MSNREQRTENTSVHILMALARPVHGQKSGCIRSVDKGRGDELEILESKLKIIGGYWRIHRTVNKRNCEKARKILLKSLIDHPEKAGYIDSEWRTSLLQRECKENNYFMLDIDTKEEGELERIETMIPSVVYDKNDYEETNIVLYRIETPKGWHYITKPFDTRNVCELPYVTLIRDGYYFVKEVGKK